MGPIASVQAGGEDVLNGTAIDFAVRCVDACGGWHTCLGADGCPQLCAALSCAHNPRPVRAHAPPAPL